MRKHGLRTYRSSTYDYVGAIWVALGIELEPNAINLGSDETNTPPGRRLLSGNSVPPNVLLAIITPPWAM